MTIEGAAMLEGPAACRGGLLTVRLLDVERIDAPAVEIASVAVRPNAQAPLDRIEFCLEFADALPPRRRYRIAAHLALAGGGEVARGDYVTMQAHAWRPDQRGKAWLRLQRVA